MQHKLLWVLSPTCTLGSSPFIKLAFLNPVWVWWPISCWNLDKHTDLVHSLLYIMSHFPGYNHNRHRRVFLSSLCPTPTNSLQKFQFPGVPANSLDLTLCMHYLPPLLCSSKGNSGNFGPDGLMSLDAAECLGKPDTDSWSTSVVNIRLPTPPPISNPGYHCHALLLTLAGSWRGCFISLLVLYQSPLGKRLGLGPSGMGQSLVWVIVNVLIFTSGPLWFISPLYWSQLLHLYLSFPWDVFFLRSQVSHSDSVLLDCPVINSSRSA